LNTMKNIIDFFASPQQITHRGKKKWYIITWPQSEMVFPKIAEVIPPNLPVHAYSKSYVLSAGVDLEIVDQGSAGGQASIRWPGQSL